VYGSFEGKDKGAGRTAVLFVSYTPIWTKNFKQYYVPELFVLNV
jgi:hypothetical protein